MKDPTRVYRYLGMFAPRKVRVGLVCIYAMKNMCTVCKHATGTTRKQPDEEKKDCLECLQLTHDQFYRSKKNANDK